jgi:hypothetical protein
MTRGTGATDRLAAWLDAGLITNEQAASIRAFEHGAAALTPRPSGITIAVEAIAYLGVVLALAATFALWAQLDAGTWERATLTVGVTVIACAAGWILGRGEDPGLVRLGSTLWLLATGTAAFGAASVIQAIDPTRITQGDVDEPMALAIGVAMAVVGWLGYLIRHHPITHIGAFAGTVGFAFAAALFWSVADQPHWIGVALAGIGIAWYLASPRLAGPEVGPTLATGALVVAPLFGVDRATDLALVLGVAVSAATVALGIRAAGWGGLAIGGVALFGYSTAAIVHFFGDTIGAPLSLLIAGALLLVVAVVVTRLRRSPGGPSPTA